LTEALSDEKIVISPETRCCREKIAERKTVVYETRIDTTVVQVTGERLKVQLFTRFGFMKPRPEEIQFVSVDKYYEPYMVISGRYFIDYYRKCAYKFKVDKKVLEIILLNHRLKPNELTDSYEKNYKEVKLEGEERLMYEVKTSLILDRLGQEVTANSLPSAPSERNPKNILKKYGAEEIPPDADLKIIRSKIHKRPKDASRIVKELFEVTERTIIYTPRFRIVYKNVKTGNKRILEIDGVTSKRIHTQPSAQNLEKLT
jgi:hypothetical protein